MYIQKWREFFRCYHIDQGFRAPQSCVNEESIDGHRYRNECKGPQPGGTEYGDRAESGQAGEKSKVDILEASQTRPGQCPKSGGSVPARTGSAYRKEDWRDNGGRAAEEERPAVILWDSPSCFNNYIPFADLDGDSIRDLYNASCAGMPGLTE